MTAIEAAKNLVNLACSELQVPTHPDSAGPLARHPPGVDRRHWHTKVTGDHQPEVSTKPALRIEHG